MVSGKMRGANGIVRGAGLFCVEVGADGLGELGGAVLGVLGGGPMGEEAVVRFSGDDVEVEVVDELACGAAVVVEEVAGGSVGGFDDGVGDGGKGAGEDGEDVGRAGLDAFDVGAGDDEGVAWGDGSNVEEGEDVVVLVDDIGGDVAGGNFTEDAFVGHGDHHAKRDSKREPQIHTDLTDCTDSVEILNPKH